MPDEALSTPGEQFKIPAPSRDELSGTRADLSPIQEEYLYATQDSAALKRGERDWQLTYILKIILVPFVLGVNIWWAHWVRRWISDSGQVGSKFHLGDTVLVALATTSVANFLALILVVMKSIFPEHGKS